MAKVKTTRPKISVSAHAWLAATASASFQRKKVITEIVPADVTRAKTSAWLDLISPITEWAGLKGDELRRKRDLLRIQQDAVLNSIVHKATKRLMDQRTAVTAVPNKFLVPFLEKASLEEEESPLIDTWVSLLTAAATDFDPHMVRFCSILAEIGPREVSF